MALHEYGRRVFISIWWTPEMLKTDGFYLQKSRLFIGLWFRLEV